MASEAPVVLVIEDGDEYLDNLSLTVPGPRYLQAHDGAAAIATLEREPVDLLYLDMRFDRIEPSRLLGASDALLRRHQGDARRAERHLQLNQGLYILHALSEAGHGALPTILAYDFSAEAQRFEHLRARHPGLTWVPDAITPEEIAARMRRLLG